MAWEARAERADPRPQWCADLGRRPRGVSWEVYAPNMLVSAFLPEDIFTG